MEKAFSKKKLFNTPGHKRETFFQPSTLLTKDHTPLGSFTQSLKQNLALVQKIGQRFPNLYPITYSSYHLVSTQVNSFESDKKALLGMIMDDEELQRQLFITAQQEHDKLYKVTTNHNTLFRLSR